MPPIRPLDQALSELRRLARIARRRPPRVGEAAPLIARILGSSRTTAIEERAGGLAFRLETAEAGAAGCAITCVLHDASHLSLLTGCEREVATLLCEGKTLAQIARLRGVSINTVKSQVRQIFRKLDVDTRVALVRRLCP
jgi:DNA-binding CsgD family transcriptional regulator